MTRLLARRDDRNAAIDWISRAEQLLEAALSALRSGEDALPLTSAVEAALRISDGELPESELDGYLFPDEDQEDQCTCPPELKARGGFTSACPECAP